VELPPGYRLVRRERRCGKNAVRWSWQWKRKVGLLTELSRPYYTLADVAAAAWRSHRGQGA